MKITIETQEVDYDDRVNPADNKDVTIEKYGRLITFEGLGFVFKVKASDLNAALNALNAADPS